MGYSITWLLCCVPMACASSSMSTTICRHMSTVFGGGEAKINLIGTQGGPDLVWADNMTRSEVRRSMRIVAEQRAFLLQRWEDIHGRAD
jgi:hypothetical protein